MKSNPLIALGLFATLVLVGCNETNPAICPSGAEAASGLAVVNSDFQAITLSSVDPDGLVTDVVNLVNPEFFSGDVVLTRDQSGVLELLLVDRSFGSVSLVNPVTCELEQFSVATLTQDFDTVNPHSGVVVGSDLYVARYGSSASMLDDFANDRSNDIAVLNLLTGELDDPAALNLNQFADTGYTARPEGMVRTEDDWLVTALQNFSPDFMEQGFGKLVIIDPSTNTVVDATPSSSPGTVDPIVIEDDSGMITYACVNPTGGANQLPYDGATDAVYVACSADFSDSFDPASPEAYDTSGVFRIDLSALPGGDATVSRVVMAAELVPMPTALSGNLVIVSDSVGFVATFGIFGSLGSRVFAFNPSVPGAKGELVFEATGAFDLQDMVYDPVTERLFLSVAAPLGVHVFDVDPSPASLADAASVNAASPLTTDNSPGLFPGSMTTY